MKHLSFNGQLIQILSKISTSWKNNWNCPLNLPTLCNGPPGVYQVFKIYNWYSCGKRDTNLSSIKFGSFISFWHIITAITTTAVTVIIVIFPSCLFLSCTESYSVFCKKSFSLFIFHHVQLSWPLWDVL